MSDVPLPDGHGLEAVETPARVAPEFVVTATTEEAALIGAPTQVPSSIAEVVAPGIGRDDLNALGERLAAQFKPLADLARKIDGVQASLDREGRAEATREKVVDRLHAELQEYKNDFLLKVMRPVFLDLIQLHDDMGKRIDAQADSENDVAQALRDYQQGIIDVLYRQGVEPFYADGDTFEPRHQRAIQTVATEDPELNKQVASRLRCGFQSGDKVIRPEMVSVYALRK
jgi:molecular chaperone GrpE